MGKRRILKAVGPHNGQATSRVVIPREAKIGGRWVYFCEAGLGAPIVMIHGLGASSRWWFPLFPQLTSANFRVLALDLPGFGRTGGEMLRMGDAARAVIELVDRIGLGQFFLCGHSMGAVIAAQIAADYSARVRRVVLIDSAGIPGVGPARVLGRLIQPWSWCPAFFYRTLLSDMVRAGPRNLLSAMKFLNRYDVRPTLRRVRARTLVIWGADDQLTPVKHGQEIVASLGDGRLELIPKARHLPMVRYPSVVSKLIVDFFREDLSRRRKQNPS